MNWRLAVGGLFLAGCSVSGVGPVQNSAEPERLPARSAQGEPSSWRLLARGDEMTRAGSYRAGQDAYRLALEVATTSGETDRALFALGRVYAAPENPDRDYRQAYQYFDRLVRQYPESRWTDDARAWREVVAMLLAQREELATARLENDRLQRQARDARREVERVRQDLERLKQVEVELERSRRP